MSALSTFHLNAVQVSSLSQKINDSIEVSLTHNLMPIMKRMKEVCVESRK